MIIIRRCAHFSSEKSLHWFIIQHYYLHAARVGRCVCVCVCVHRYTYRVISHEKSDKEAIVCACASQFSSISLAHPFDALRRDRRGAGEANERSYEEPPARRGWEMVERKFRQNSSAQNQTTHPISGHTSQTLDAIPADLITFNLYISAENFGA